MVIIYLILIFSTNSQSHYQMSSFCPPVTPPTLISIAYRLGI